MSRRWTKFVRILLIIGFLVGAGRWQKSLNTERDRMGLTLIAPLENAPPVLAFTTVALGGFRGLIANILWIRASDMQEQDKYFEMVQLADWITKLEPHFAQVWVVQAWNMAYNISIKFPNPEDRWRWVRRGIELLRDEGLKHNPNEAMIYGELGRFFYHKIGMNLDDAHRYYKGAWMKEMSTVFSGPRPNFEELIHPSTPEAKKRSELLISKYKMDPAKMLEVDKRYGPLEWRLPEAHAIYWAYRGLEKAKNQNNDVVLLRREIYQSMQLAYTRGAIIERKAGGGFMMSYNLDLLENANRTYLEMIEKEASFSNAHKNFLINVPYVLYTYNRQKEARYWLDYLKKTYPKAIPKDISLEDYAVQKVTEEVGETSVDKTQGVLEGLVVQSFMELIQDEDARAVNYDALAQRVWSRFQTKVKHSIDRVGLPPLDEIKKSVLERLLDPQGGLSPEASGRLRTKLGLPVPTEKSESGAPVPSQ